MIEIICSISLLLLVVITLMNIVIYTIKTSQSQNDYITINQIADNLEYYIKSELKKENVSLIDINKDECIINYETFIKTDVNKEYKLSNKKLRYFKDKHSIILNTRNSIYLKNEDGNFIKIGQDSEGHNIVDENIKYFDIKRENGKIYFNIILFQNSFEKLIKFEIDDIDKKDFISN